MKWFDNIYVINLDKRPDRLERITKEFKRIGYSFERISAVDGDLVEVDWKPSNIPGWNKYAAALAESTIKVIKHAKENGYKRILIVEDDTIFSDNAKEFLDNYEMPEEASWDMFFFGVINDWKPIPYDKDTNILTRAYCCHCYAVHSRVFDDYLFYLEKKDKPIDWVTADHFMIHRRCMSTKRPLAYQLPDYSDIRKKKVHNKVT